MKICAHGHTPSDKQLVELKQLNFCLLTYLATGNTFDHKGIGWFKLCLVSRATVITELPLCSRPTDHDFERNTVSCVRVHRSDFVTHDPYGKNFTVARNCKHHPGDCSTELLGKDG